MRSSEPSSSSAAVSPGQNSHQSLFAIDDVAPIPAGRPEELAEHDLRVAGRKRSLARLVVVARVVEEVDACVARGAHHRDAGLPRDPLERTPGAERERRDVDARCAERPVLHV